ncbi:MAG: ribokinase [Prevotellaceae bacterium]|jgi:ribokinase|nr:ribokinase [Prevotellaceae bacterium]
MHSDIVVIGSSNTDMVIKSERLPAPGETIIGGVFMMNPGGKGANQAVAAARMGGTVAFISKIGNDLFGKESIDLYKKEKINTDYIFSDPTHPSGIALINVDAKGENCITVASGANATLSPDDIDKAKYVIESARMVLIQLEIPIQTVEHAAKIAHKKGIPVVLNPAPMQPLSDDLLECIHTIIPNKTETEMLTGIKVTDWESAQIAANAIGKKGIPVVILTLGSLGALVKEGDQFYIIEAIPVQAIDATAAGDTFCGALCVGLSEGMAIDQAVSFACRASAVTVTKMGAQASIPYRHEI